MTILLRLALLLCFCAQTPLLAKNHKDKKNAVLVNVGTIPFGLYEARYERKLDKHFSISTVATYYEGRKVLLARVLSYGYMMGIGVSPKFHIYGEALDHGFYLAPHLNLGYLNHPKDPVVERRESILLRVGANFGFAHVFSNGIALDFSAGLERYHNFYFKKQPGMAQSEDDVGGMFRPTLAASIGYAF